jgi:two-component system, chemotaxis family, protein-glutamate methylesterase/glutaminase
MRDSSLHREPWETTVSSGYEFDQPITLSCPECAGTLRCDEHGGLLLYRCHIGHRLTGKAMLHAQMAQLEQRLCSCLSLLNERAELCRQLSEAARRDGRDAEAYDAARRESLERARSLRSLLEVRWLRPEVAGSSD